MGQDVALTAAYTGPTLTDNLSGVLESRSGGGCSRGTLPCASAPNG